MQHYWRPFVVPPTTSKITAGGAGTLVNNVWYAARWALNMAEEIHVLGYSLPPSDFEADTLFREGLYGWATASRPKRVVVVNREREVLNRFMRCSGGEGQRGSEHA